MNLVITRSRNDRLHRAAAGLAVAALLLSACAADDDALATDEQAAPVSTDVGVLPTVSGGQIDTSSLEGTDTILWFWAPW